MKYTLLSIVALITLAIVFYPQKELISKEDGSPGGNTNSPGDGQNCTACHSGTLNSGVGTPSITTNIPASGYAPGQTYTLTSAINEIGINRFGFELTAEDNSNKKKGTFFITNSAETKLVNSNAAVTHKFAGTSGTNSKIWSFDWQAPITGTGSVTFYSSCISANNNGNNNGDNVYSTSITVIESIQIPGCTDSLACNYDSLATIDDSSCILPDGCTDSLATNYDSLATCDDGSCVYLAPSVDLFFSEYAEGSSSNRYFEVYNPTNDTIDLSNYAFARVSGNPTTPGVYETWHNFDSGSVILPFDIYVVAHPSADSLILIEADMTISSLSNGNDGMALVYGLEPASPVGPSNGVYIILDWLGDWNGNPGQGWEVAGISAATRDHTLIRKCPISVGDTSWTNAAGTNTSNSQWIVKPNNYWNDLGAHTTTPSYDSLSFTICSGQYVIVGNNIYDSTGVYLDSLQTQFGCDSIITTALIVLADSASITTNNITICDGDSIIVTGNVYNSTGTYSDTLISSNSCDSIINTNLTVQTPTYQNLEICDGNSITVGVNVYDTTGNYVDTITSSMSCDSIVYTNLSVLFSSNSVYGGIADTAVASGGFFTGNRHHELDCYMPSEIVSAVVYADTIKIITFELRDNNGIVLQDITDTVYPGVQRINFNFQMPIGTNLQLGIASSNSGLYRSNQGVNYPYNFSNFASITGSSAGGNFYYFFYDIEMRLSSDPTHYSVCAGDSIYVGNSTYFSTGVYVDSLTSISGCDSVVHTDLAVYPHVSYNNAQTICSGEVYTIGNNVYDSTGVYIDSLNTQYGCDSVVTTNLTVDTITGGTTMNNQAICFGDSVSVGNSTYYYDGIYNDTLQDGNGCDSIIITTLVTNSAAYGSLYGGIPDTVSGPGAFSNYNGQLNLDNTLPSILKSAAVYAQDTNSVTFELRDDNGVVVQNITHTVYPGEQRLNFNFLIPVDSNLHLGVSASNSGLYRSDTADGGNWSYPFNIGPVTINSANNNNSQQYYYFYYDLEIMPYASYNDTTICLGDSISVGSNIYTTSGNYTDILTANNACDSIVYTILDLYQSPPLTINTVRICDGESITINGTVYAATGVYTDTYNAFNGCDSIVETHLTVDSAVTAQISQNGVNIGANVNGGTSPYTYFWSSGEITQSINPQSNGSYWVIATDTNGCNSDTAFFMVTFIPSGIDDILNAEVNIYPNPTDGLIHINSDLKIEKIELFSMEGKLLKTTIELSILLDVKGTYFIKIFTEPGNIIKRVVVN